MTNPKDSGMSAPVLAILAAVSVAGGSYVWLTRSQPLPPASGPTPAAGAPADAARAPEGTPRPPIVAAVRGARAGGATGVPPGRTREKAADFSLPDLQGRQVRLSDFRGKVVLLDFWATWCIPCLEEMPELKAIHSRYAGRGFSVVGVSMDEDGKAAVAPIVKELAVPYTVVIAESGRVDGYRVHGIPTAFLIDRRGQVVKKYFGPKRPDELDKDIAALLDEAG